MLFLLFLFFIMHALICFVFSLPFLFNFFSHYQLFEDCPNFSYFTLFSSIFLINIILFYFYLYYFISSSFVSFYFILPKGEPLRVLAARHGMRIQSSQNFHDLIHDFIRSNNEKYVILLLFLSFFNIFDYNFILYSWII